MTQGSRISDAFLGVLLNRPGGDNLVWARRSHSGFNRSRSAAASFLKDVVTQRMDRVSQVCRRGPDLAALASARVLNGPKAWEVDHLYLAGWVRDRSARNPELSPELPDEVEGMLPQLLDGLVQTASEQGAERVFLRCPTESAVVDVARHAGFAPCFNETLLRGQGCPDRLNSPEDSLALRGRLTQDAFGLFQLYSSATPQLARMGLGFTLDQWWDAQEPDRGRQWVATCKDKVAGWAGRWSHAGVSGGQVLARPSTPEIIPALISAALAQPGPHLWQVPDHQEPVRRTLLQRGFQETAEITLMVKTVHARKFSRAMAAVEAQG